MNRNLKDKSYNEVMNQWAAQKHFLKRAAHGLARPGQEVQGGVRVMSWVWRVLLFTGIPILIYLGWMRIHGKSEQFTNQLAAETKKFLSADHVAFTRTRWDANGELRVERIQVNGAPQNFFTSMDIGNIATFIPMPRVFRAAWHLDKIHSTKAALTLRAGSLPKQAAAEPRSRLLTAGWGISPDFSQLRIGSYFTDALTLDWGGAPSTTGGVAGSKASLIPAEDGWDLALTGGVFHQCWMDGLRITSAAAHIGADRVQISKGDFTVNGGGSGTLTGSFTLGEQPEVDVNLKLENIQLHQFTPEYFSNFAKATGAGTVKITGSTNLGTGLLMDASFVLQNGRLSGLPILRALEIATGETAISAPEITGGHARVTSQGTSEQAGQVIEAENIEIDCGTRMKISFSVRHERKELLAANYKEAIKALQEKTKDTTAVSTTGTVRIGLPPATAAKLKPAIRQQFITREAQGLQWMDIPFDLADGFDITKQAADQIVALELAK